VDCLGDDGLFANNKKIITTRVVPARLKIEIETEKWIVWAPGLIEYYCFLSKIRGRRKEFWERGAKQKRHTTTTTKNNNTNNNNTFNKCAERKGTLDEETTKRTR